MKQSVKNLLGSKNAWRIGLLRKSFQVKIRRYLKRLFSSNDRIVSPLLRTFSFPEQHLFFGYYDVPQFSHDESLLLATAVNKSNKGDQPGSMAKVGFYELNEKEPQFHQFGLTETWCWQQGCRLQWFPFEGQDTALYNKIIDGQYGCIIQNVHSCKIVRWFTRPLYTISRDGKWGLSINFSRLQRLRPGYGYDYIPDSSKGSTAPSNDGIWRIDLETGQERCLFSIQDISALEADNIKDVSEHYFNHLLFNDTGDRFMFFHIKVSANSTRKVRLLTSNIDGNEIRLLNGDGNASHYCWKDKHHLLCYSTVPNMGAGYHLYDVRTGKSKIVGAGILTEDGHPSYLPDCDKIVTDTYPDKYGELSLLLYDCKTDDLTVLAKEFVPLKFNSEARCDLHPRVSPLGDKVCIDSIVANRRVMKLFNLSSVLGN